MDKFSKNLKAKEVEKKIDLSLNQSYPDWDVLIATSKVFKSENERDKLQQQLFDPITTDEGNKQQDHSSDCKKKAISIPKAARPKEAVLDISKFERKTVIMPSLMSRSEYTKGISKEEVLKREKLLKRPVVSDEEEHVMHRNKDTLCRKRKKVVRFEDSDYDSEEDRQIKKAKKSSRTTTFFNKKKSKSTNKKSKSTHKKSTKVEISNPPRELLDEFMSRIISMGGKDVKLVITKRLTATDCKKGEGRLSMPFSQIGEFLFEEEKVYLQKRKESDGGKTAILVKLIQPNFEEIDILMRLWEMNKENGCSYMYVLARPWNDVVVQNGFKEGDAIQVWSFRMGEELGLVIVRLPNGEKPADLGQLPNGEGLSNVGQLPYGEGPPSVGQLPYGEGPSNVGQFSNGEEAAVDVGQRQSGEESANVGQLTNDEEPMDVGQSSTT